MFTFLTYSTIHNRRIFRSVKNAMTMIVFGRLKALYHNMIAIHVLDNVYKPQTGNLTLYVLSRT
jgi:hypothetical protein